MNKSAKLALLVVFALAAVVIGYYVVQNKKDNRIGPSGMETLTVTPSDDVALSQAQQPGAWTGEEEAVTEEAPDLMARVRSHIDAAAPAQPDSSGAVSAEPPTLTLGGDPLSLSSTTLRNDAPVLAQADTSGTAPVASDPTDAPEAAGDAGLPPEALTPAAPPPTTAAAEPLVAATTVPTTAPLSEAPISAVPVTLAAPVQPAPIAPAAPKTYTIQSGDTFSSIASQLYGKEGKWTDIAQANPLVDPAKLKIGQVIKLPEPSAAAAENAVVVEPATSVGAGRYVVQSGDTLSAISKRHYGTTAKWKAIYDANRSVIDGEPEDLREGMKLTLPER